MDTHRSPGNQVSSSLSLRDTERCERNQGPNCGRSRLKAVGSVLMHCTLPLCMPSVLYRVRERERERPEPGASCMLLLPRCEMRYTPPYTDVSCVNAWSPTNVLFLNYFCLFSTIFYIFQYWKDKRVNRIKAKPFTLSCSGCYGAIKSVF